MIKQKTKATLLIVDDTPDNIDVLRGILEQDYGIRVATNGELAIKLCNKLKPDLVLLDVMMPGMNGYQVCEILKANPETAGIPVIFVTALGTVEDEQHGFHLGGVDYITKPVRPAIVMSRVRTHLALANQQCACLEQVERRTRKLEESQRAAINMLGEAGHYNDTDTGTHIWRMAAYAAELARSALWPVERVQLMELAAPMHDTGKIGISDDILKAPRKLTEEEWKVMQTHTEIGHRILSMSDSELFSMAADIALYHHEKWDGTGYPKRLRGEEIPESARIVAIADVFDALTMNRPYKKAWPVEEAFDLIQREAGKHFDPDLVEKFLQIEEQILMLKKRWDNEE